MQLRSRGRRLGGRPLTVCGCGVLCLLSAQPLNSHVHLPLRCLRRIVLRRRRFGHFVQRPRRGCPRRRHPRHNDFDHRRCLVRCTLLSFCSFYCFLFQLSSSFSFGPSCHLLGLPRRLLNLFLSGACLTQCLVSFSPLPAGFSWLVCRWWACRFGPIFQEPQECRPGCLCVFSIVR